MHMGSASPRRFLPWNCIRKQSALVRVLLRDGKAINLYTDRRNGESGGRSVDCRFFHFDLWWLTNLVGRFESFAGHPRQRCVAAEANAAYAEVEFLLRVSGVHNCEREKFLICTERSHHIQGIRGAPGAGPWQITKHVLRGSGLGKVARDQNGD